MPGQNNRFTIYVSAVGFSGIPNLTMCLESSLVIALWLNLKMASIWQGQTKFVSK